MLEHTYLCVSWPNYADLNYFSVYTVLLLFVAALSLVIQLLLLIFKLVLESRGKVINLSEGHKIFTAV